MWKYDLVKRPEIDFGIAKRLAIKWIVAFSSVRAAWAWFPLSRSHRWAGQASKNHHLQFSTLHHSYGMVGWLRGISFHLSTKDHLPLGRKNYQLRRLGHTAFGVLLWIPRSVVVSQITWDNSSRAGNPMEWQGCKSCLEERVTKIYNIWDTKKLFRLWISLPFGVTLPGHGFPQGTSTFKLFTWIKKHRLWSAVQVTGHESPSKVHHSSK